MNEVIPLLEKLVAIPSVFPKEQQIGNFICEYLRPIAEVRRIPAGDGRDNIVATIGTADEYMCLYGHMDTVPPDPDWSQDPFTVRRDGDILRGLGVADMKGGIAAVLRAARYAHAHHLPLKLAFGVDEENISLGSHVLVQSDFFQDVGFVISAESGQIYNEKQDFAVNYGRKGRFVMEIDIVGRTAHAARSDVAVNAIAQAAIAVQTLEIVRFTRHRELGSVEIIPYHLSSTTDSFSIPAYAHIKANVLTVPGVTSDEVLSICRDILEHAEIEANVRLQDRATPFMEAYQVDRSDRYIHALEQDIFPRYITRPGYAASVADENRFAHELQIPVISLGPIGGGDHTASEWVSVRSLEKTYEAYCDIVTYFASQNALLRQKHLV